MRVLGIIIDASKEKPLPDAKLSFHIGEKELAVLYSDREGRFEHKEEISYLGETLICQVEKKGYKPQKVTHKIEQEEVQLEIELVPEEEEKLKFQLECKDNKGNQLEDVSVSLEIDGEGVGVGISDKNGLFKITLSPDFKDKTLNFKAELGGFELTEGEVHLEKETSLEITMNKIRVTPPRKKWPKIALASVIVIVIILIISIVVTQRSKPPRVEPKPPGGITPRPLEKIRPIGQPDLTVSSVSIFPAQPAAGHQFRIVVYVRNIGNAASGEYDLAMHIKDLSRGYSYPVGTFRLEPLHPGENVPWQSELLRVNYPGAHEVLVEIRPFNFADRNTQNNSSRKGFQVQ